MVQRVGEGSAATSSEAQRSRALRSQVESSDVERRRGHLQMRYSASARMHASSTPAGHTCPCEIQPVPTGRSSGVERNRVEPSRVESSRVERSGAERSESSDAERVERCGASRAMRSEPSRAELSERSGVERSGVERSRAEPSRDDELISASPATRYEAGDQRRVSRAGAVCAVAARTPPARRWRRRS